MIHRIFLCIKKRFVQDARTGELVQTEVIRIKRKSFLRKYNKKNGWYTNWEDLDDENEVYDYEWTDEEKKLFIK